jgi:ribosomal protein L20
VAAARTPSAPRRLPSIKSMQYAYRDRKNKKRTFRALWIQRINAAVREEGLVYGKLHQRPEQGRR